MTTKYIVTVHGPDDEQSVRNSGCEIVAEYPDSILVRGEKEQEENLRESGVDINEVQPTEVQVSGASFQLSNALQAEESSPVRIDASRVAYYLVELVGPAKGEWLNFIAELGGSIQGKLRGFTLVVGIMPSVADALREQPWVEAVTPFRPAMKVSPKLRPGLTRQLATADLESVSLNGGDDATVQIEVSVFPGESTEAISSHIRNSGGMVLSEGPKKVTAVVPPRVISEIADEQGVQAIMPHAFPKFFNDQARQVMSVPNNNVLQDITATGNGQVVGIADSGLDSGDPNNIHADFTGRVDSIVSLPTLAQYAQLVNDPPNSDDGPADTNSGHGTHVAGSVLGNGSAAGNNNPVPRGVAPEARAFFQAVEQTVNWKSAQQLINEGFPPNAIPAWWPPAPVGLYGLPDDLNDLFTPAYNAGARVHTNSWGSDAEGVYNDNAREVDEFMWNNRDMLILFAAGNEGVDNNVNGVVDQDSMGAPGTAKNCLTVGASENDRPSNSNPQPGVDANWTQLNFGGTGYPAMNAAGHVSDDIDGMAAFSSRGPTDDGRIKPDLVAPGTNVLSVRSQAYAGGTPPLWGDLAQNHPLFGEYCWSGGTSMSTPLVAGSAALIRQHLVQQRGHHQDGVKPSGALVKAILVNGTRSMSPGQFNAGNPTPATDEIPPEPNNVNGFGMVDMVNSLTPGVLARTLFADEPDYAVETGQVRTFQLQVVDTNEPLKVTLTWTDAPGVTDVGGLVNELYLRVVQPGGAIVNGDLTPFPNVTNNVQRVVIDTPVAGTYEVRVHGVSVVQQSPGASSGNNPRQDFAVAVCNAMGFTMQPVSIAQAIDTTGSMGTFGYMEPAKERATQLVDFMRINDKVSITEFSDRTGVTDDARTVYPLRLLGGFSPDWTDARNAIDALVSDGMTPIGAGLQEAWNQLQNEPTSRPRAIVLLSDGLNNRPPDPNTVLQGIPTDVPIFTIALGPAGNVGTLQSIANSRPGGGYYAVESDEDVHKLHEIYAQIQAMASGASIIGLSSAQVGSNEDASEEASVEPGAEEATFTLSWGGLSSAEMELVVIGPDGQVYNGGTQATMERRGATYHMVRVAKPQAGKWSLRVLNQGSRGPVAYTVSSSLRSPVRMIVERAKIDQDRLLLIARLMKGNKPLTDAKIAARVTAPTLSLKEIMEKHGDEIQAISLPDEIREEGLSNDQILLLKVSEFARKFGSRDGGIFGKKASVHEMEQTQHGVWTVELPLGAPGSIAVELVASGRVGESDWERHSRQTILVPETVTPVPPKPDKESKRMRIVLEQVQILDDKDFWFFGSGEFVFTTEVAVIGDSSRTIRKRIPTRGYIPISDMKGRNIRKINQPIFEGKVTEGEELTVALRATELDIFSVDHATRYNRAFKGDLGKWIGKYAPGDEVDDPEAMKDWRVWYRVEEV